MSSITSVIAGRPFRGGATTALRRHGGSVPAGTGGAGAWADGGGAADWLGSSSTSIDCDIAGVVRIRAAPASAPATKWRRGRIMLTASRQERRKYAATTRVSHERGQCASRFFQSNRIRNGHVAPKRHCTSRAG